MRHQGSRKRRAKFAILFLILVVGASCGSQSDGSVREVPPDVLDYTPVDVPEPTAHWQAEMAGEVTEDSVILQARMTLNGQVRGSDVEGRVGLGAFALSTSEDFRDALRTRWMVASPEGDYIVKTQVTGLERGTRFYYRLLSGPDVDSLEAGPTGTFRTLDGKAVAREVSFVVVTGMNRFAFQALALKNLAFDDLRLGFPALSAIASHQPDFFVSTGDNVYYDSPFIKRAATRESMRAKWHRQFATPRFAELFQRIPTYWEKDDHDFRYDDADPYGEFEPSAELGAEIFLEQVPVVVPGEEEPLTYRTHQINDLVQIWLLEVRDHRDRNTEIPGPDKTIWGAEQRAWLQRTLLESDATFKILISPTALVGPDDSMKGAQGGLLAPYFGGRALGQGDDERKRDNHTNIYGFKDEGEAFFAWLTENELLDKNLYLVCGDKPGSIIPCIPQVLRSSPLAPLWTETLVSGRTLVMICQPTRMAWSLNCTARKSPLEAFWRSPSGHPGNRTLPWLSSPSTMNTASCSTMCKDGRTADGVSSSTHRAHARRTQDG